MQNKILRAMCGLIVAGWLAAIRPVSAQPPQEFVVEFNSQEFFGPNDKIVRANGAPLVTLSGAQVGTADMTSLVFHRDTAHLTAYVRLSNATQSLSITQVASSDGRFRQTFGFNHVTGDFFRASVLPGAPRTYVSLSGLNLNATDGARLNQAFTFTRERTEGFVGNGNTLLAYRPDSLWDFVPNPGGPIRMGWNFSYAFANATHSSTTNVLQTVDALSGVLVTCTGPSCYFAGYGDFAGYYGVAGPLNPPPAKANAASYLQPTQIDQSAQSGPGCPGPPPPPANRDSWGPLPDEFHPNGALVFQWDSVKCAERYVLRVFVRDGRSFDIEQASTFRQIIFIPALAGFAVASIDHNGTQGPFSEMTSVHLVQ